MKQKGVGVMERRQGPAWLSDIYGNTADPIPMSNYGKGEFDPDDLLRVVTPDRHQFKHSLFMYSGVPAIL